MKLKPTESGADSRRKPSTKASAPGKKRRPHSILFTGTGRTRQAHKEECDINNILAKFARTGALEHANKHSTNYGFAPSESFTEAMQLVAEAQRLFDDLPAQLRKRFGNSPEAFLEFVQNPENQDEIDKLGLGGGEIRPHTVAHDPVQPPEPETKPEDD